jgi:hypothetical protein
MKRAAVVLLSVCAAVLAFADAGAARRAILDPTPLRPVGGPIVGVRSDGERFVILRSEQPRGDGPRTVYTSKLIDTWTGRRSALPSSEECVDPAISEQTTTVTAGRALLGCLRDGQSIVVVRDLATGQETRLPSPAAIDGQPVELGYQILGRHWVKGERDCPGGAVSSSEYCEYYVNLSTGEIRYVRRDVLRTPVGFYDIDDPALPLRRTCRAGAYYDEKSRLYAPPFYITKKGLSRCSDGQVVQSMGPCCGSADISGGFASWGYETSGYDWTVPRGSDRVYVYNIARKRLYAWKLRPGDRLRGRRGPVGQPIRTLCTLYVAVTRGFTEDGIVNRIRLYTAPMPPPRDPRCTSR